MTPVSPSSVTPPTPAVTQHGDSAPRFPAESLFLISAIAQYTGATIAVRLFDRVEPATVAWFRVIGAAVALFFGARILR